MEKFQLLLLVNKSEDAATLAAALERSEFDFTSVSIQGGPALTRAVTESGFDVIVAYRLPGEFTATDALQALRGMGNRTPFVFVADDLVRDRALQVMRAGAYDCIAADELASLPVAIKQSSEKYRLEREQIRAVEKIAASGALMADAAALAGLGSWEADLVNNVERWSDEQYRILWLKPGEAVPGLASLLRRVHPEDVAPVTELISEAVRRLDTQKFDCRIVNAEGQMKYISVKMAVTRDAGGRVLRMHGYVWDASEYRIAEMNEKEAMAGLMQRNKDLEQFAYIISHNLRAPVANIVGVSNALLEDDLDREEVEEYLNALSFSVKKLDNTITDLNHILQVKEHIKENMEQVSFAQLVDEIKSTISVLLDDQCFMIQADFAEVPEMWTLKSYMRSIFYNLVSNSVKYRKPGMAPVIEIKSRRHNGTIVLTFKDNSIGMNLEEKKDQLFGLYKRFHPQHAEGKGMGLFMVKTQVETLGGKISVQSKVNEGAEFKIEFEIQNIQTA